MASRSDSSGKAGDGSNAMPRGKPSPDAVARAMAEVEKTLERLKQVRTERAEAEKRFKAEIALRDEQIGRLQAERDEIAESIKSLESRLGDLTESEASGQAAHQHAVAEREAAEHRAEALDAQLQSERGAREAAEARIAEIEGASARQAEEFREQLLEAEQRERELAEVRDRERGEAEAQIAELRGQVEGAGREAEVRAGELSDRADAAEARAVRAEAHAGELQQQLHEVQQKAEGLVSSLDSATARLQELESAADARAGEAAEALRNAAILEAKVGEQQAELDRLGGELEAAHAAIAERDTRLADAQASGEAELGQLRSDLEEARRALAEHEQTARAAEASAKTEIAELYAMVEQLESERDGLRERAASAEQAAAAAREMSDGESAAAMDTLRQEAEQRVEAVRSELGGALEAEREQVRELTEKLDLAADRLAEMQSTLEDRDRALAAAGGSDKAAAELTRKLEAVRQRLAEVEQERDRAMARGGGAAGADARLASRRARLARQRVLLRERRQRADKQAQILDQRLKQCDDLLARRRELAEAKEIIEKTHKRVLSSRAKAGAGAAVFFAFATIVVLAGLSWAVVTRTFPATYAASAVLSADFLEGGPGPGDLERWQEFHEGLLGDPNLMTRVSERMAQRGFEELSQPAAVKAMLESDLTASSPQDGKLVIELRGLGRDATVRKLDTFVTTLAVEANALRQRRTETATTIVAERARPGVEPIEDPRLEYAGIGVGAGAIIAFLLWTGIWLRMVKSKRAFEHETEIEGILEESVWVDPIQQIIDARPDSPAHKAA